MTDISVNDSANSVAQAGLVPVYQKNGESLALQSQLTQTIGTQDLVAIRVANKEKQLRAALAERSRVQREAKEAAAKANTKFADYVENYASLEKVTPELQKTEILGEYLKLFDGTSHLSTNIGEASVNIGKREITFTFQVNISKVSGPYNTPRLDLTHTITNEWESELTSLYNNREAADVALREASNAVAAARSALANIESMERDAKARLSTAALESAGEQGQAVLDQLTSDDEELTPDQLIDELSQY